MDWDKVKMAQQFLAKANALHPEEAYDEDERTELQALQDLYYECYMTCFSREKLSAYLDEAAKGNFKIAETSEPMDEPKYRSAYARHAQKVKRDMPG